MKLFTFRHFYDDPSIDLDLNDESIKTAVMHVTTYQGEILCVTYLDGRRETYNSTVISTNGKRPFIEQVYLLDYHLYSYVIIDDGKWKIDKRKFMDRSSCTEIGYMLGELVHIL